jgi:hypothetical protein
MLRTVVYISKYSLSTRQRYVVADPPTTNALDCVSQSHFRGMIIIVNTVFRNC